MGAEGGQILEVSSSPGYAYTHMLKHRQRHPSALYRLWQVRCTEPIFAHGISMQRIIPSPKNPHLNYEITEEFLAFGLRCQQITMHTVHDFPHQDIAEP